MASGAVGHGFAAAVVQKTASTSERRHLAAADGLDELLEARGLLDGLGVELAGLAGLADAALGRHLLLGQVLGAVLELGLCRAGRRGHVTQAARTPLGGQTALCAWAISLLAHLLDRGGGRRLGGV